MNREPIQPTRVYKPTEAAEVLAVDKSVVYSAIQNGELPKIKLGRGYKLLGEHLLTFAGSATYQGDSKPSDQEYKGGAA